MTFYTAFAQYLKINDIFARGLIILSSTIYTRFWRFSMLLQFLAAYIHPFWCCVNAARLRLSVTSMSVLHLYFSLYCFWKRTFGPLRFLGGLAGRSEFVFYRCINYLALKPAKRVTYTVMQFIWAHKTSVILFLLLSTLLIIQCRKLANYTYILLSWRHLFKKFWLIWL